MIKMQRIIEDEINTSYSIIFILVFGSLVKAQDIEIETRTYMKGLLCSKHDDLVGNLEQEHGEARKWWAINSHNELVELFVIMKMEHGL